MLGKIEDLANKWSFDQRTNDEFGEIGSAEQFLFHRFLFELLSCNRWIAFSSFVAISYWFPSLIFGSDRIRAAEENGEKEELTTPVLGSLAPLLNVEASVDEQLSS